MVYTYRTGKEITGEEYIGKRIGNYLVAKVERYNVGYDPVFKQMPFLLLIVSKEIDSKILFAYQELSKEIVEKWILLD